MPERLVCQQQILPTESRKVEHGNWGAEVRGNKMSEGNGHAGCIMARATHTCPGSGRSGHHDAGVRACCRAVAASRGR